MLSLLLAIIVSSGIRSTTAGLETSSLGFGEDLQNNDFIKPSYTAQTSNYGYYPQQPFIVNNFGNRGMSQIPIGVPRLRRAGHTLNPAVVTLQNSPYPSPYQRIMDSGYPPQDSFNQYYLQPFYEVIEYYKSYDDLNEDGEDIKSQTSLLNNQTTEEVVNNKEPTQAPKEEESPTTDRELQMTYLGFAPQSSFKNGLLTSTDRSSSSMDDHNIGIPFYPLNLDEDPKSSKSNFPPILLSPYRLDPDFLTQRLNNRPDNQENNFGYSRPIVSPYPSVRPGFPSQGNKFSAVRPHLSSYRSNPSKTSPKPEDSSPSSSGSQQNLEGSSSSHDGYYLIDVQPLKSNHELSGYRAIDETFPRRPPVPLRPVAPIFHEPSRPTMINTNSYSNSGSVGEQQSLHKVEQQEYDAGYETHTPQGTSYSKLHTNKEILVEKNDNKEGQTFNRGTGMIHNFASPEMGLLVRRLLMIRNSNGLQGVTSWRVT